MKVILTGGGTGGHIFPAIAIADSIKKLVPDVKILFVGAKGKLEERIVPENNYEIKTIKISGLNRRNLFKNISLPIKIFFSLRSCKKILKDFNPDIVIGTGGFASSPLLYECKKMRIPYFIQEGNVYPGKVTKMFSNNAEKVFVNFEETKEFLKRTNNVFRIPHPIRKFRLDFSTEKIKKDFGINNNKKVLFVFGGSQGSLSLNNAVENNLAELLVNNINVIWQTGNKSFKDYEKFSGYNENLKILPFIKEINKVYLISDLVVCRAGISSIMELALLSKPSILVPYPYAAENHQLKNAQVLEKNNACKVILDNELNNKFLKAVIELIQNDDELVKIGKKINQFSVPDSADKIAEEILKNAA